MRKIGFTGGVFLMCISLCACSSSVQYQNVSQTETAASPEAGEKTETPDADTAADSSETPAAAAKGKKRFIKSPKRRYYKGVKRTFMVGMNQEKCTEEEQAAYWKKIQQLDGFLKGQIFYFWAGASICVPVENLNPAYLSYMKKENAQEYRQIQKNGYDDLEVMLYTIPGCTKTVLSQTNVAKNQAYGEYTGGSITSYRAGDTLDANVVWQAATPAKKEKAKAEKFTLDSHTMDMKWFWDQNVSLTMLQIPYEQYFSMLPEETQGLPDYYIVKSKKGMEKSLRSEIENILGENGGIYESSYYQ